jgi:hypothetical protein
LEPVTPKYGLELVFCSENAVKILPDEPFLSLFFYAQQPTQLCEKKKSIIFWDEIVAALGFLHYDVVSIT